MAKEKKGQKFGRHSRAPSNAMQQQRTARNKRKNEERAHTMRMQQPEPTKQDYEKGRARPMAKAEKLVACAMQVGDMAQKRREVGRESN